MRHRWENMYNTRQESQLQVRRQYQYMHPITAALSRREASCCPFTIGQGSQAGESYSSSDIRYKNIYVYVFIQYLQTWTFPRRVSPVSFWRLCPGFSHGYLCHIHENPGRDQTGSHDYLIPMVSSCGSLMGVYKSISICHAWIDNLLKNEKKKQTRQTKLFSWTTRDMLIRRAIE